MGAILDATELLKTPVGIIGFVVIAVGIYYFYKWVVTEDDDEEKK